VVHEIFPTYTLTGEDLTAARALYRDTLAAILTEMELTFGGSPRTEADTVLYDEPTSGLDPVTAASIDRLIVRLNSERGVTSVVVTHDLASALKMSTRVMLLKDGRVLECAAPREFLKSTNPAVKEFIAAAKGELS
jgi:ABC-type transporter Mla maintaining outer membrane lipid asymmetry ATPase subunit MlaF